MNARLETHNSRLQACLGPYQELIDAALADMEEKAVIARLWSHDHTLWKPDPRDITNRLGWLHVAEEMRGRAGKLEAFAEELRSEGFSQVFLIGMGGSSLAPEVYRKVFGVRSGFLDLIILDSTVPETILNRTTRLDPAKTLFIVSTKSGDTVETLSLFKYCYRIMTGAVGAQKAGRHFMAITDPGSPLAAKAGETGFRATLLGDPGIGGRYSALSLFGLSPAALIGLDLRKLLDRALQTRETASSPHLRSGGNEGALLGAILGEMAKAGRDKMTLITAPALAGLGDWVEQLIAESTGKEGKGILPIIGEPLGPPGVYGDDRLFISLSIAGNREIEPALEALETAGHPVIRLHLSDLYDLGSQFFLWEIAAAIAGNRLGINPFDQPDVESAKNLARMMMKEYLDRGQFPSEEPLLQEKDAVVYGHVRAESIEGALCGFLDQSARGGYIALQAYFDPGTVKDDLLQRFRTALRARYRLATTTGYGPRFLHSTGQLHKGDGGRGLFIQLTADDRCDVAIPDDRFAPSAVTFGTLKSAQAMGDRRALESAGRQVIRFHLGSDIPGGLNRLLDATRNKT